MFKLHTCIYKYWRDLLWSLFPSFLLPSTDPRRKELTPQKKISSSSRYEAQQIGTTLVGFSYPSYYLYHSIKLILITWNETRAADIFTGIMWEGTAWGARKGQLLAIPVWKWFCNRKPLVTPFQNSLHREGQVVGGAAGRKQAQMLPLRFSPSFHSVHPTFAAFIHLFPLQSIECRWTDGWMKEWAGTFPFSSTCTERLLRSPLINGPGSCFLVFVVCACLNSQRWWAGAKATKH